MKQALVGGVGLLAIKQVRSRLGFDLGNYNAPVENIATGAILRALKQDNADLISAGIKMAAAQVGSDLLSGGLNFGGMLGTATTDEGV